IGESLLLEIRSAVVVHILRKLFDLVLAEGNISSKSPSLAQLVRSVKLDPGTIGIRYILPDIGSHIIDLASQDQLIRIAHVVEVGVVAEASRFYTDTRFDVV